MACLKNRRFHLMAALATGALLAGCAAQAPSMAYHGQLAQGVLHGQTVCVTTSLQGAQFAPFVVDRDHREHLGDWIMLPQAVAGMYNNQLTSALRQEGATIVNAPAQADVVIRTTMTPTQGHQHLVWTKYLEGKSIGMAFIPLTHSRYFEQYDHIVEQVSVSKKGGATAQTTLRIDQVTQYKSSNLEGGSQEMDGLRIYRDLQAKSVKDVLKLLS